MLLMRHNQHAAASMEDFRPQASLRFQHPCSLDYRAHFGLQVTYDPILFHNILRQTNKQIDKGSKVLYSGFV